MAQEGVEGDKQCASLSKHSRQIRLTVRAPPYSSATPTSDDDNYIIVKTSTRV